MAQSFAVFCSNVGRRAGWFWWMLNFIFLKRDYEKDKKKIQAQLKSLVEKAKQYSTGNFWLMIFPEGTRLKPKKLAQAQAFSKEKGLPVFNHCLVPRIKGLQASIDAAPAAHSACLAPRLPPGAGLEAAGAARSVSSMRTCARRLRRC